MDQIQQYWYQWGAYVALVVALLCAIWVFMDAARKGKSALVWQIVEVIAVIVIVPSVVFAILPEQAKNFPSLLMPLTWLGIVGAVAAVVALLLYLFGVGVGSNQAYVDVSPTMAGATMQPTMAGANYTTQAPSGGGAATYSGTTEAVTGRYDATGGMPQSGPTSGPALDQTMNMSTGGTGGESGYGTTGGAPMYDANMGAGETGTMIMRAAPKLYGYFVFRTGIHKGRTVPLGMVTNIGRRADANDIVLDDESVSREHARVRFEEDQFVFTDLASGNGSFVKDGESGEWKKIHQITLSDKMLLKLGETQLTYMEVRPAKEES